MKMKKRPVIKKKRKGKKKLTPEQLEQRQQEREIRTLLTNIGFKRLIGIGGKEVKYKERTSEMDDMFFYENIVLVVEYTIGKPGAHLIKKSLFYNKINEQKVEFINFLLKEDKLKSFKETFDDKVLGSYSKNQLQLVILYCSKQSISEEHKTNVKGVVYFDYHIVKYFESLAKVIKKSTKHEFLDFLGVPASKVGDYIKATSQQSKDAYSGHILPEEHSSFAEGYKIISFYVDADSLLKRAYVLRQNGWRKHDNIGHYQRMFINTKIRSMRKYLHENKRVFINNIIATLSTDKIRLFDGEKELTINEDGNFTNPENTKVVPTTIEIVDETNIIGLVDGQHRTYAYHEGDDIYEDSISKIRGVQNLLVTGILFPASEKEEIRLKFEAKLFMEINANQSGASSQLKQEIELMVNRFSTVSIAKRVLDNLNTSGPLSNHLERFFYEKGKIKTASIVSFGLQPLLKLNDDEGSDSLYSIWEHKDKKSLKKKGCDDYELLDEYIKFSTEKIRDIVLAFQAILGNDRWMVSRSDVNAFLSVSAVNGILNVLRKVIENNQSFTLDEYKKKLQSVADFPFKEYKSSQYRKMGEAIYKKYLKVTLE